MISYDNFWETMKRRNMTKYALIYKYGLSSNTLRRMAHNEPINTTTLNQLCLILHCEPQDILSYYVTEDERAYIKEKEAQIKDKQK